MAAANSNIQLAQLDFAGIKNNLLTYLNGQSQFNSYNFAGSGLNILLDLLAYNTHYNAYYLNMVGNEMFLDTALIRNSVVSHAKLLNYTPRSAVAPSATVDLTVTGVTSSSLTLPKFTSFMSQAIDGVNYNFVTTTTTTVNVANNTASFSNIELKQGNPSGYNFTVDIASNPKCIFEIPDNTIDTSTLTVTVQKSSIDTTSDAYTRAVDFLTLNDTSTVYFLQEGINGNYEIYFGDGVIGKQLSDGNIVKLTYVSTEGTAAAGANSFVMLDSVSGFSNVTVSPKTAASNGSEKETIDSIKYQAPKAYSAQNRAVTKEDYITVIQQNNIGYTFDAVNVWGGEENNPPVYGQIFIAAKPTGAYTLSDTQKTRLLNEVIKPVSIMTVQPNIVDPDYTYIKLNVNVYYDPKKTTKTSEQLKETVISAIKAKAALDLDTFNSTFSAPAFNAVINSSDNSIITNEFTLQLQKKIYPNLTAPQTYKMYFGAELKKGMFNSGVYSTPGFTINDPVLTGTTINGVFIEEIPSSTAGIQSISLINLGFGYQSEPTVTILGDGTGATATAKLNTNGTIKSIDVTNAGNNYTTAVVSITPAYGDTTGQLGAAVAILSGGTGTLRSYYYNTQYGKTIINDKAGTIDYVNGVVTLDSLYPIDINNDFAQLSVTATPTTTIVSSTYNRIITLDSYDSNAIVVNIIAKT